MPNTDLLAQQLQAHASSIGKDVSTLAGELGIYHPAVVALARSGNAMTEALDVLWAYTSEPLRQPLVSLVTARGS